MPILINKKQKKGIKKVLFFPSLEYYDTTIVQIRPSWLVDISQKENLLCVLFVRDSHIMRKVMNHKVTQRSIKYCVCCCFSTCGCGGGGAICIASL